MLKYIALIIYSLVAAIAHGAVPTGYPVANYQYYESGTGVARYVSATDGDDVSGDGTIGNPWNSLSKALYSSSGGDTIYLRGGNYGDVYILSHDGFTDWVTINPYPGESAIFSSIEMSFDTRYLPANLRFDGITVQPTPPKTNAIAIRYGKNIEFRNVTVSGYDKYICGSGIKLTGTESFLLYKCKVDSFVRGISIGGYADYFAKDFTVDSNEVFNLSGSTPLGYGEYCQNAIISRNIFRNSKWVAEDEGAPAEPTHGSCMSIRSSSLLFDSNVCRSLGSSSAIMTYTDDSSAPYYHDIYIRNNLFYDIYNDNIIRFYNITEGVEVTNNTIIGHIINNSSGSWLLGQGIVLHTLYGDADGSGITIANNIIAARSILPTTATIKGNIMYAVSTMNSPYVSVESWANNTVLTHDETEPTAYFIAGFFNNTISFAADHGMTIDYSLSPNSPARDTSDSSMATGVDITGRTRDTFPDIGAYEYFFARRLFRNVRLHTEVE